jgi:hypothetical protein
MADTGHAGQTLQWGDKVKAFFGNDAAQVRIKEKNILDAVSSGSSSSDDQTFAGINDQQALKTSYGLGNKTSKYKNGDTLWYPQELFTPSQPHGVHFYINARQTSVSATDQITDLTGADLERLKQVNEVYNKGYTQENRAKSEQYDNAAMMAGTLAGAIGTATVAQTTNLLEDASNAVGKVATGVIGGIAGGALGKWTANNTNTIRLMKSIQLHVPASVVAGYTADWNETTTGAAGIIGSGRGDISDIAEMPEFLARGFISAAANVPKGLGANADFGAVLEATSKKVANPYKEQLFKSMGFRRFAFNYHFAPRNLEEAEQVLEIIDTFKYHMHPEASEGDMFLIYPAEFSIVFEQLMFSEKDGAVVDDLYGASIPASREHNKLRGSHVVQNPYLPKVSSCALTGCKVTYGPDGMFNTFQETDGIPSEMTMELMFTELETLTAVRIAQGF